MALDDVGGLWIATRNQGVAMARCDELLAAMEHPGTPPVFTWFDTKDGLGSKGGSFTSEGIRKGPDGRIWVATDGGLSVIDPRQWLAERDSAAPLSVHIEECTADGKAMGVGSPVRIPAGTARVGIRFATLNFGFPGEVRYRHRLRGLSDNWVDDGENDEAFLQQLRPGDYEFEVIAANRFGIWSSEAIDAPAENAASLVATHRCPDGWRAGAGADHRPDRARPLARAAGPSGAARRVFAAASRFPGRGTPPHLPRTARQPRAEPAHREKPAPPREGGRGRSANAGDGSTRWRTASAPRWRRHGPSRTNCVPSTSSGSASARRCAR